jgi:hypothetical protein
VGAEVAGAETAGVAGRGADPEQISRRITQH